MGVLHSRHHRNQQHGTGGGRKQHLSLFQLQSKNTNSNHDIIRLRKSSLFGHAVKMSHGKIGLVNLGNTCFMNSAVQCLSNTIPLTDYFLSDGKWKEEVNVDNPIGTKGEIAEAYGRLIKDMWSGKGRKLAPKLLKQKIGQWNTKFRGNCQHDSQELLAFLLDGLHEDLNRVRQKKYFEIPDADGKPDEMAAAEAWKFYLMRNKSIIVDLFQGQLRSTLKCCECGYTSVTFDPFMYLSLPVVTDPSKQQLEIGDLLREFLKEEKLTGDERWRCKKCETHVDCIKKIDFWKVPPILIVHLKRFGNGGSRKIDKKITFPLVGLDFKPSMAGPQRDDPVFDLYAVSNHHGGLHGGHYTAYAQNRNDSNWYQYNDASCSKVNPSEVVSKDAYVLFYKKKVVKELGYRPQSISQPHLWPHTLQQQDMDKVVHGNAMPSGNRQSAVVGGNPAQNGNRQSTIVEIDLSTVPR